MKYRKPVLILFIGALMFLFSLSCGVTRTAPKPAMQPVSATSTVVAKGPLVTPVLDRTATSMIPHGLVPMATPTAERMSTAPAAPVSEDTALPVIQEDRRIVLEYPPAIRAGGADTFKLVLELNDKGEILPTAEIAGHRVMGEPVSIPNLYDTHRVMAEARLDLAGVQVRPADTISEPLLPGRSVIFYWSVSPSQEGNYRGTVWLHLTFIPIAGGESLRRPIYAKTVEIQAVSLLGLPVLPVQILSGVGTVLASVIGFPFLEDILKWLWKRRKIR